MLNMLSFGKHYPHVLTCFHLKMGEWKMLWVQKEGLEKQGREGRQKRKPRLISKQQRRTIRPTGNQSNRKESHSRNEVSCVWKAQASRNAIKRVILSNEWHYRATPHGFAKYNYQVVLTFPGGRIIPFLWSRPSADVIDLTLQKLLTTQMHSPIMPPLFLCPASLFWSKTKWKRILRFSLQSLVPWRIPVIPAVW